MKKRILALWKEQPLTAIMLIAFIIRLPAVIFSKGFGWHDDHFLIIESSQSWVDGVDYDNWFPWSGATIPDGHSLFYSGLHFILFTVLKWLGIYDPQLKMMVVRLLHALFSLLTVYYGYKIARLYKGDYVAKITGLLLACYWFMPFLSVRNLIEFVCIPFLVWGTWLALPKVNQTAKHFFFAGFIIALAVSVRYQASMMAGGVILALMLKSEIKGAFLFFAGALLSFVMIQAPFDYLIWKKPFAEFGEYVRYNMENSDQYGANTWYSYLLVILGMLLPPVCFFLFYGYLKSWKKYTILFLPSFIFLVFHSSFPNKQERFILTIIPFIIIAGVIGFADIYEKSNWSDSRKRIFRRCVRFSIVFNLLLLPLVSIMYSKRARVESMYYLSKYRNIEFIAIEDRKRDGVKIPPEYYAGQWLRVYEVTTEKPIDSLAAVMKSVDEKDKPRFILFFRDYDLQLRINQVKNIFSNLTYETTIEPGFIDKLLNSINPKNGNDVIYIYKTNIGAYEKVK